MIVVRGKEVMVANAVDALDAALRPWKRAGMHAWEKGLVRGLSDEVRAIYHRERVGPHFAAGCRTGSSTDGYAGGFRTRRGPRSSFFGWLPYTC
jgi:hypothetical protein